MLPVSGTNDVLKMSFIFGLFKDVEEELRSLENSSSIKDAIFIFHLHLSVCFDYF